jgi:hypothetical protein
MMKVMRMKAAMMNRSRKKKLLILQLAIGVRHLRWVLKFAKYQIFINVTYFINNRYYERI